MNLVAKINFVKLFILRFFLSWGGNRDSLDSREGGESREKGGRENVRVGKAGNGKKKEFKAF